ncbi:sensor histidine kinase [Photobacterium kasasachensis]|uniref:sensor histidine kinase n=1 Tax=Photobacterium kasasachensis TaxID=2910240 RepID=UPI003D0B60C5
MKENKSFFFQFVLVQTLLAAPGLIMLPWLLWSYAIPAPLIVIATLLGVGIALLLSRSVYQTLSKRLNSYSNLLYSMARGDCTHRARYQYDDEMGHFAEAINELADRIHHQQMVEQSTPLLLRKVVKNINVAIIAVDGKQQITWANPQAEHLFSLPEGLVGESSVQLGLDTLFKQNRRSPVDYAFPAKRGRWQLVDEYYYDQGKRQQLFFITDVSLLLREEELKAWKNLLRVLSHEINNSLTPIATISDFLRTETAPLGDEDLQEGLTLISQRAKGLEAFIKSYRHVTHLPAPNKADVQLEKLVRGCMVLMADNRIRLITSPSVVLMLDRVQIEQVIINLLKNALEAVCKQQGVVTVSWNKVTNGTELLIVDNGCGISNPDNLFVPFYSTKKQGSGIGLLLCRQVLEAHHACLSLQNNTDEAGVTVRILFTESVS